MSNILEDEIFQLGDLDIPSFGGKRYQEFCEGLEELTALTRDDDLFIEKVHDYKSSAAQMKNQIVRDTVTTSKGALSTYNNITSAGGSMIRGFTDLAMQCINAMAKVFGFMMNKVGDLPRAVGSLATKASQIPQNVRDKIQGNIKVYISAEDIRLLYNQSLMKRIEEFVLKANALSQGDTWGTFFHPDSTHMKNVDGSQASVNGIAGMKTDLVSKNDMQLLRELKKLKSELGGMTLELTTVEMNSPVTVALYFGGTEDPPIVFKDLQGKEHRCFYIQALQQLVIDLKAQAANLQRIEKDIRAKKDRATGKSEFARLPGHKQKAILDGIQSVSSVVTIIGKFIQYCIADTNTINNCMETIIKKGGVAGREIKKDDVNFLISQDQKRVAAAEEQKRRQQEAQRNRSAWNNDSNRNIDPRTMQKLVSDRLANDETTYTRSGQKKRDKAEKKALKNQKKVRSNFGHL